MKNTFYKNNRRSTKDIPLEVIEYGLEDADWRVRRATINACQGRYDMPVEVIERWLNDDSSEVRQAAIYYCEQKGILKIRQ